MSFNRTHPPPAPVLPALPDQEIIGHTARFIAARQQDAPYACVFVSFAGHGLEVSMENMTIVDSRSEDPRAPPPSKLPTTEDIIAGFMPLEYLATSRAFLVTPARCGESIFAINEDVLRKLLKKCAKERSINAILQCAQYMLDKGYINEVNETIKKYEEPKAEYLTLSPNTRQRRAEIYRQHNTNLHHSNKVSEIELNKMTKMYSMALSAEEEASERRRQGIAPDAPYKNAAFGVEVAKVIIAPASYADVAKTDSAAIEAQMNAALESTNRDAGTVKGNYFSIHELIRMLHGELKQALKLPRHVPIYLDVVMLDQSCRTMTNLVRHVQRKNGTHIIEPISQDNLDELREYLRTKQGASNVQPLPTVPFSTKPDSVYNIMRDMKERSRTRRSKRGRTPPREPGDEYFNKDMTPTHTPTRAPMPATPTAAAAAASASKRRLKFNEMGAVEIGGGVGVGGGKKKKQGTCCRKKCDWRRKRYTIKERGSRNETTIRFRNCRRLRSR
jgi:DNA-directed RNA polymerase subunit F